MGRSKWPSVQLYKERTLKSRQDGPMLYKDKYGMRMGEMQLSLTGSSCIACIKDLQMRLNLTGSCTQALHCFPRLLHVWIQILGEGSTRLWMRSTTDEGHVEIRLFQVLDAASSVQISIKINYGKFLSLELSWKENHRKSMKISTFTGTSIVILAQYEWMF